MTESLTNRLVAREATVAVLGLGYVGLPLAISFAEVGYRVIGFDVSDAVVTGLNAGTSHIDDVAALRVGALVAKQSFRATVTAEDLVDCDVMFICVPTPFDKAKNPDLSYVESATRTVAKVLRHGMLVVLQSTTYPGTTTEFVRPILEETGLRAGIDFHLAFSPERVDPGNVKWNVRNTPKVVGGLTPQCTELAKTILLSLLDDPTLVRTVESPDVAEMAKLLENTYRAVNIALVNELAQLCHEMGIDVWSVIDAAATKPFGFQAFYPGIGPGGHCIPVDPFYLAWKAREYDFQTRFIELAADINDQMAAYVITRMHDVLNERSVSLRGANILCLGAAFKRGVSDVRNSRAIHVMELLRERGAVVSYCDPNVPSVRIGPDTLVSLNINDISSSNADLVAVLVGGDWPLAALATRGITVFDAVNAGGVPGNQRQRL
ncbi:MAG: nucleotide sugar dehydrogenase [Ilumatobacteraceae bacterium]|nr:nucleotide sugar dehydrogenase [Ilumatobacteraceae bacterium]